MTPTQLLYLENMQALNGQAKVLDVFATADENGAPRQKERFTVILDQTYLYPQGGGQPYDQGFIKNESGVFKVEEVRFLDGLVHHIGYFETGQFRKGEEVSYGIDKDRRELHTRLHSGGHLIDMALYQLGVGWKPSKGYHFPDGAYVEYEGNLDGLDKANLIGEIEKKCSEFITQNTATSIQFMPKEQMHTVCHNVPDYLPEGKPSRVVLYGDFGVPCGGTHVKNLGDVKTLRIRNIKAKGGKIKVGYDV